MNAYIQQERYKDLQDAAEQQEAQRVSRIDVIALSLANHYPECITDFANMLNMPVEVRMFLRGPTLRTNTQLSLIGWRACRLKNTTNLLRLAFWRDTDGAGPLSRYQQQGLSRRSWRQ